MKKTIKRIISLILVTTILALANISSLAAESTSNSITVKLNGKVITFDAQPRSMNGRTLVPVTTLAKQLGAIVEWIPDTKSIIITLKSKGNNKIIYLKIGQASALVNGMEIKLDATATVYDNRTFVPLRFIAENFGAKIDWISKTKTINITYVIPTQEEPPILIPPWKITTSSAITFN